MDYAKESLRLHEQWGGKIEVNTRVPVSTKDDLSLAYTPGVAQPCLEIQRDPDKSYTLTRRHNLCAVITDGSAVLGLGDIGPEAGMPVMEGKCALFKEFADVDAFPLCIRSKDTEELIRTTEGFVSLAPYAVKGGIVRTADAVQGVMLKGVDGDYDWSSFGQWLVEGELPRVGDSLRTKELLLSARTARLLGVHAGDKVEMLFVAGDERPRRDRFKVSGLYSTGMEELERTALTDLRNVQRLSGWSSGEVSGYDLFLGDVRQADRLAEAVNDALLRSDLPETDGVVAVSVGERYPAVFDWLKAHDVNAAVVIAVMVAVAFFNMASALLILVLERTRMIGLLKAMGMENRRIRRIFLYRAAFIVGRGLLWGNLAAGLLCWLQARFHLLRLDPAGYKRS